MPNVWHCLHYKDYTKWHLIGMVFQKIQNKHYWYLGKDLCKFIHDNKTYTIRQEMNYYVVECGSDVVFWIAQEFDPELILNFAYLQSKLRYTNFEIYKCWFKQDGMLFSYERRDDTNKTLIYGYENFLMTFANRVVEYLLEN